MLITIKISSQITLKLKKHETPQSTKLQMSTMPSPGQAELLSGKQRTSQQNFPLIASSAMSSSISCDVSLKSTTRVFDGVAAAAPNLPASKSYSTTPRDFSGQRHQRPLVTRRMELVGTLKPLPPNEILKNARRLATNPKENVKLRKKGERFYWYQVIYLKKCLRIELILKSWKTKSCFSYWIWLDLWTNRNKIRFKNKNCISCEKIGFLRKILNVVLENSTNISRKIFWQIKFFKGIRTVCSNGNTFCT